MSIYETYSLQIARVHGSKYVTHNCDKDVFLILSLDRVDLLPATWTFGLIGLSEFNFKEEKLA